MTIEVRVYNYAAVSADTLARSQEEAARIYQRTGIRIEWLDCPLTPEEAALNTACDLPAAATRFTLRLLSRSMAQKLPLGREIFGLALLPPDGEFGVMANVCAGCAQEMTEGNESPRSGILGHLMTHELGHLLLGTATHSAAGIMHIPWRTQELERIKQGVMFFLPEQSERIRAQVLARTATERAAAFLFSGGT